MRATKGGGRRAVTRPAWRVGGREEGRVRERRKLLVLFPSLVVARPRFLRTRRSKIAPTKGAKGEA